MRKIRRLLVGCISLAAVSSAVASCAASESQSPEWLFVQASSHARVTAASTLEIPVQSLIFGFTDRPDRQYAYLSPAEFVSLWDADLDSGFSTDPPNAVLTWRVGDQVGEAELVLTDAHYSETDAVIVYEISIETGELTPGDLEVVSLFVDDFAGSACDGRNCIINR